MPRWLVPTILTLVGVSSAAVAVRWASTGGAGVAGPSVATPVLSARRVPAIVSRLVADTRLRAGLGAALDDPALGPAREQSCLVVHQGPRTLVDVRPDLSLIPASNLKILTALAVLARIDPDDHLVTEVRAAAPPVAGVVDGPLWLVGGGDPLLATADYAASFENQPQTRTPIEALADSVVAAGVRVVEGGVMGDEARYDTQRYIPTWKPSYMTDAESGPASALDVNDGFSQFKPSHVPAPEPAVHAAGVLTALLQARGVVVKGPAGQGRAPAPSTAVAAEPSAPVREIVAEMLRESDNLTAELLVKELGRRFGGAGTTSAGLDVLRDTLGRAGLAVPALTSVDGSGLDRSDRATCSLLLSAVDRSGPAGIVATGFPLAAHDGTLAKRFVGSPAAGRLRAKTGSLDGVVGLSGYVAAPAGDVPLSFSLLANDLPRDVLGRTLQDRVGAVLAAYPDAPAPEAMAP